MLSYAFQELRHNNYEKIENVFNRILKTTLSMLIKENSVHSGNVSGILLYAKTDEYVSSNLDAIFDGNRISVHTLDLNCDFKDIAKQLDGIADEYLK